MTVAERRAKMFADLTPTTGVERRVDLGDDKTLLFMDDGRVLFRHHCLTGRAGDPERHRIINAAALRIGGGHTIVSDDPVTITPSILCECDIHGYVTDSRWVDLTTQASTTSAATPAASLTGV